MSKIEALLKPTPEQEDFYRQIRLRAISKDTGQPYLAAAYWHLVPVNAVGLGTMAVTKEWMVLIDFDFAMEMGNSGAGRYLNHEIWHLLREHHARFDRLPGLDGGRMHDPKVWNYAGDLVINHDLKLMQTDAFGPDNKHGKAHPNLLFPGEGAFKDYEPGKTTEEFYYQLLNDKNFQKPCPTCNGTGEKPEDKDDSDDQDQQDSDSNDQSQDGADSQDDGGKSDQPGDKPGDGDSDQAGDGQGSDEGDKPGKSEQAGDPNQPGDADGNQPGSKGSGKPGKKPGSGRGEPCPDCNGSGQETRWVPCGSGSGSSVPGEEGAKRPDGEKLSDVDKDNIRRTVARDIMNYSEPGKLPNDFRVWAQRELEPEPVDWRSLLRGQVKKAISSWQRGKQDYVRNRRNRRQPVKDIIMPAMRMPRPKIAVGIDTSGSNVHNLGVVMAQLGSILQQSTANAKDLVVFSVDAQANTPKRYPSLEAVKESLSGGGGTDMSVAFEEFQALSKKGDADVCILLTDLETPWPKSQPRADAKYIVVGIVRDKEKDHYLQSAEEAIGAWADIILIDDAAIKRNVD